MHKERDHERFLWVVYRPHRCYEHHHPSRPRVGILERNEFRFTAVISSSGYTAFFQALRPRSSGKKRSSSYSNLTRQQCTEIGITALYHTRGRVPPGSSDGDPIHEQDESRKLLSLRAFLFRVMYVPPPEVKQRAIPHSSWHRIELHQVRATQHLPSPPVCVLIVVTSNDSIITPLRMTFSDKKEICQVRPINIHPEGIDVLMLLPILASPSSEWPPPKR